MTNVEMFKRDAYFDQVDKVYRWKSSNNILTEMMLQKLDIPQDIIDRCNKVGDKEHEEFLKDYNKEQEVFWTSNDRDIVIAREEHLFEMTAAFGPGVEVTNIFTGRTHITK